VTQRVGQFGAAQRVHLLPVGFHQIEQFSIDDDDAAAAGRAHVIQRGETNRLADPAGEVIGVFDFVAFFDRPGGDVGEQILGQMLIAHDRPGVGDQPSLVLEKLTNDAGSILGSL